MRTYVFVDVETTGVRTHYAEMIEVSAMRWEDGEIVDSFSSLLKPKDSIPEEITQITGITDAMVKNAPKIDAVRADLRRVIGDAVVVGHNVDFDLGFLQEEFLAIGNHKLDTITLTSILFPTLGRYGLQNLIQLLDIPSTEAHRAEADVRATIHLFGKLLFTHPLPPLHAKTQVGDVCIDDAVNVDDKALEDEANDDKVYLAVR